MEMWSSYNKIFCFRDCFDESTVEGDVEAINKLLDTTQANGEIGVFITSEVLSTSIANHLSVYQSEDDGTWNLEFYNKSNQIASVSTWNCKEIQLDFEIEERVETGEVNIHYCTVKCFKNYQQNQHNEHSSIAAFKEDGEVLLILKELFEDLEIKRIFDEVNCSN
jgi:hypothetical protein